MNPSDDMKLKLFWLEFLTSWCGPTTMERIGVFLGMTREAAQRALCSRSNAGFLSIKRRPRKGLVFEGDIGDIKYAPSSPRQYMTALAWDSCLSECLGISQKISVPFEDISWVASEMTANSEEHHETFRLLAVALSMKSSVALTYRSKKKLQSFEFSPHALVRTAFRAHFRGFARYEDGHGRYMDLVPDRVVDQIGAAHTPYVGDETDHEWNTFETLKLEPSDIDEPTMDALRQEYGQFPVIRTSRKANARYIVEAFEARLSSMRRP